jgi:hypothetical protein
VSWVAEQKAMVRARIPVHLTLSAGWVMAMPSVARARRICMPRIQPRRWPRRPSTGNGTRSTKGAHRNGIE